MEKSAWLQAWLWPKFEIDKDSIVNIIHGLKQIKLYSFE